jgi:hypothetical protein
MPNVPARLRRGSAPLVAALVCGFLVLGSAPAGADPVDDLLGGVEDTVTDLLAPEAAEPQPREDGPLPVAEDDDPDREQQDPAPPDHGSADNAEVELAENDVAGIGQTEATVEDDDDASADASALSLGGNEIIGAHAEGNESETAGDPLEPVCSGSDGALCAQLVYAEASSSERDGAQSGDSSTAVTNACVGGSDTTPEDCDGPVGAGVLTSDSEIDRDRDGHTEASSSSSVAEVCLVPDPVLGCTVGAEAVSSEGSSSSRGEATKDSTVLDLTLPEELAPLEEGAVDPLEGAVNEPFAVELPPDCPADLHLACVFANQGETYLGSGVAGHAVTALDATVLNGTVLATISQSESLARKFPADAGDPSGPGDGPGGDGGVDGPGADGPGEAGDGPSGGEATDDGVLPNTGGVWTGFLTLALAGVGLGSLLVAWSRRNALGDGSA